MENSKVLTQKILFVCTGNTCRSPMAEVVFNNMVKAKGRGDWVAKGVGLRVDDDGEISLNARAGLKNAGEQLPRRRMKSVQFAPEMFAEYDLIMPLTRGHYDVLSGIDGFDVSRVRTLDSVSGGGDVVDPFNRSIRVYEDCVRRLQRDLQIVYEKISSGVV